MDKLNLIKTKKITILFIILTTAGFLRFYNLMHDAPYFFNPDERNMAIAVTQFRLPDKLPQISSCLIHQIGQTSTDIEKQNPTLQNCNLNPHFFAYGQFPLYLAYVSDQLAKPVINFTIQQPTANKQQLTTNFPSAIFWLRFWSALASTFTVLFVYLISRKFLGFQFSILSSLMAAFSPGLIQSAHFGTTESLLTFFFFVSIYLSIKLFSSLNFSHLNKLSYLKYLTFISLVNGLAIATKLTGLFFLVPPVTALISAFIKATLIKQGKTYRMIFLCFGMTIFISLGSLIFSVIFSPYNLIDFRGFLGSVFGYERDVAMGLYEAFYTRQFVGTLPIIFQAEKVFPYTLGWPIFILGSLGFILLNTRLAFYVILLLLKKQRILGVKNQEYKKKFKHHLNEFCFFLLIISFLIYLIPNAFLFAKWTRFMTPIFPFFSIFAAYAVQQIYHVITNLLVKIQKQNLKLKTVNFKPWLYTFYFVLCILLILPGLMFVSIYTHEDSRLTASKWIYSNIPNNSYILSETANVVDIPLHIPTYNLPPPAYKLSVISFDFYHMDDNPKLFDDLINHLIRADYILIPSRRIFANYMRLVGRYPKTTKYYQLLFSGKLGFEKVAEISSFPKLLGYTFPDEQAEETFTVFDHPVIRIYKKTKPMTEKDYRDLFKI